MEINIKCKCGNEETIQTDGDTDKFSISSFYGTTVVKCLECGGTTNIN